MRDGLDGSRDAELQHDPRGLVGMECCLGRHCDTPAPVWNRTLAPASLADNPFEPSAEHLSQRSTLTDGPAAAGEGTQQAVDLSRACRRTGMPSNIRVGKCESVSASANEEATCASAPPYP
mmetsp:Transcript_12216/g.37450  ORF Transcript_12216/g.37450 Transcript_12216/m.37450 type:complete len:121 (+) Transcript_12216:56-418(+)|eukprot:scaffold295063_cov31-Tisochrysis_lutea.AAC.6